MGGCMNGWMDFNLCADIKYLLILSDILINLKLLCDACFIFF